MQSSTSTVKKNSLSSVLPIIRTPKIKRKYLRKYSWLPDVFRIKGSIITRIIGPVSTITIFAALVCYFADKGHKIILTNSIVPLLSVVVGLILVFRNSTSYERFWEGRKSFASMVTHCRNMSRMVWVNVGPPPHDKGKTPGNYSGLRKRKVEALHLLLSFVFATKHYLRGEDGVNYPDYQGVLPPHWFSRFDDYGYHPQRVFPGTSYQATAASTRRNSLVTRTATMDSGMESNVSGRTSPSDSTMGTIRPDATKRIRVKRSKQQISTQSTTPLLHDSHINLEFQSITDEASIPLPLIIAHELSRKVYGFRRDGFLETVGPAGLNAFTTVISGLVDQLTAMERVANTPIPISYGIHLKQCVTLYLFALPMTLVHDLGWATVPLVTAVAFTFMGIEGIADEIEMPFGTDERDLPLDRYCQDLKEEIFYIIERLPEGGEGIQGYDDGEGDD